MRSHAKGAKKDARSLSINMSDSSDKFSMMVMDRMEQMGDSNAEEKHWSIGVLFEKFVAGRINVYPDYQRGLVSDLGWARELVAVCIYTPAPIAPILLYKSSDGHEVVDGAQRLSAIFCFMMGGYPIKSTDGSDVWYCDKDDDNYWIKLLIGGGTGIGAMIDDEPVNPNLARFLENARGLMLDYDEHTGILAPGLNGRLQGRHQSIVEMPDKWNRDMCTLYAVYTGLKAWRQTKDEYLVHLYDHASRQIKQLESRFVDAIKRCGLNVESPTRQLYGVLVRVFAVIDKFSHVPAESDEKLYVDMIMELVTRYSDNPPAPGPIERLERGVDWFSNADNLKIKGRIESDILCVLLYAASMDMVVSADDMKLLIGFTLSARKTREMVLERHSAAGAASIAEQYNTVTDKKKGPVNLAKQCEAAERVIRSTRHA